MAFLNLLEKACNTFRTLNFKIRMALMKLTTAITSLIMPLMT